MRHATHGSPSRTDAARCVKGGNEAVNAPPTTEPVSAGDPVAAAVGAAVVVPAEPRVRSVRRQPLPRPPVKTRPARAVRGSTLPAIVAAAGDEASPPGVDDRARVRLQLSAEESMAASILSAGMLAGEPSAVAGGGQLAADSDEDDDENDELSVADDPSALDKQDAFIRIQRRRTSAGTSEFFVLSNPASRLPLVPDSAAAAAAAVAAVDSPWLPARRPSLVMSPLLSPAAPPAALGAAPLSIPRAEKLAPTEHAAAVSAALSGFASAAAAVAAASAAVAAPVTSPAPAPPAAPAVQIPVPVVAPRVYALSAFDSELGPNPCQPAYAYTPHGGHAQQLRALAESGAGFQSVGKPGHEHPGPRAPAPEASAAHTPVPQGRSERRLQTEASRPASSSNADNLLELASVVNDVSPEAFKAAAHAPPANEAPLAKVFTETTAPPAAKGGAPRAEGGDIDHNVWLTMEQLLAVVASRREEKAGDR